MGNFVDITGMEFGNWKVLRKSADRNSCGQVMWVCQCKCGAIKEVSGSSLRSGASKSCGCLHQESVSANLLGKKIGMLTILNDTGKRDGKGHIIWHCKCDCGNYVEIRSSHLLDGQRSCGCLHATPKDLTNKKFNMLTALHPTDKRSGSAVIWKCKCDCGNYCYVAESNLQNGHTKSCGCLISYGEHVIHKILQENNIVFETQKTFDSCRFSDTNQMAKFDFYINNQYLLEFDGSHHYKYSNRQWNTKENFLKVKQHDLYKNDWCKNNNIPLIRIPYTHLKNICLDDLLLDKSEFLII